MSDKDLVEHHRIIAERFRTDADRYQALLYQAWNTIRGQQKGLKRQARKLKALHVKLLQLEIEPSYDRWNAAMERAAEIADYYDLKGSARGQIGDAIRGTKLPLPIPQPGIGLPKCTDDNDSDGDDIATAEYFQKKVVGALKSCIDAHGNVIQGSWIGSASKRVAAVLKQDFDKMAELLSAETERRVAAESVVSAIAPTHLTESADACRGGRERSSSIKEHPHD